MVWETAADAIANYRDRYNIPDDDPRPLGPEPPPGRFRHRHERTQIAGDLTTAARRLDHTPHDPDITAATEADRDRLAREREIDNGYEP